MQAGSVRLQRAERESSKDMPEDERTRTHLLGLVNIQYGLGIRLQGKAQQYLLMQGWRKKDNP